MHTSKLSFESSCTTEIFKAGNDTFCSYGWIGEDCQVVRGVGLGVAVMAAMAYGLGGEPDLDPASVTFGTVKVGDYRYTIFGRYNSVIRTAFMLLPFVGGYRKTPKGTDDLYDNRGATMGQEAWKFFRGKMNPSLALGTDLLLRKDYSGKPLTVTGELKNAALPMSVDEVLTGLNQDGIKGLLVRGIPSFIGAKVSNEKDFTPFPSSTKSTKPTRETRKPLKRNSRE